MPAWVGAGSRAGSRAGLISPWARKETDSPTVGIVWLEKWGGGESSETSRTQEDKRARWKAFVTDLKYTESVVLKKHASVSEKYNHGS